MAVATLQGQQMKDCVLMEVVDSKESPSKYTLDDGSVLAIRQVVQEVWRVEGEYDQENNPLYVVKTATIMNVIADPELKRPTN